MTILQKITQDQLEKMAQLHFEWLRSKGLRGKKLGLEYADLSNLDFSYLNLYNARIRNCDLTKAKFTATNLSNAMLEHSVFNYVKFIDSNLCYSNMKCATLHRAYIFCTQMNSVHFYMADLSCARIESSDLCETNLYEANLSCSTFECCILKNTLLSNANLGCSHIDYLPFTCPTNGSFIGFKKVNDINDNRKKYIIALEIPADAKRLSGNGRKCRCNKAKVLEIQNLDGTQSNVTEAVSSHDHNFIYRVGAEIEVSDFDEDRWNECSSGIHFFINRQEAVNYSFT